MQEKLGMGRHEFAVIYAEREAAQVGRCAICLTKAVGPRRLAVDHDHASGQIRGLLCTRCNLGLGYFKDRAAVLRRAVDYLKQGPTLPVSVDVGERPLTFAELTSQMDELERGLDAFVRRTLS